MLIAINNTHAANVGHSVQFSIRDRTRARQIRRKRRNTTPELERDRINKYLASQGFR